MQSGQVTGGTGGAILEAGRRGKMAERIDRRELLRAAGGGAASLLLGKSLLRAGEGSVPSARPNLVFIFADQWRAQAAGYAGDPNARTPNLDRLAGRSIDFRNAVSTCPVCCPYRASLLTGQYPLTHGVFLNDVPLGNEAPSIARVLIETGYDTAYIGKWHLDGIDRGAFIPPERRQGFHFWRAYGCTHDYNNSFYYADLDQKLEWEGYDAAAQTREANSYIREHAGGRPFCLFLSWGPPHAPYHTAPERFRAVVRAEDIRLRENVPERFQNRAREDLAGYYAHIAALDECLGEILATLEASGIDRNTILVFTSDHGDMLYSQGGQKKQQPWDESVRVPFLLRYPARQGDRGRRIDMPFGTPDIMPTLLGLSGVRIPSSVEGRDCSAIITGEKDPGSEGVLISCPSPFGQWQRSRGGREYRGIRTADHTYARDLQGPWLLYDNRNDPFQLRNLCDDPGFSSLQDEMDARLTAMLAATSDEFLPGWEYIRRSGYLVDASGTVEYRD